MKVTKYSSVILILMLTFSSAMTAQQPSAADYLKKIRANFDQMSSFSAEFRLDVEFPEEDVQSQTGSITQKGERFKLDIEDYLIINNGNTIWTYEKARNEVQITNVDNQGGESMFSPQSLLDEISESSGALKFTKAPESGKTAIIEYVPFDRDEDFFKIRLTIRDDDLSIAEIKSFLKDGTRYVLRINAWNPNVKVTEQQFQFDTEKYPGIHVEDLRL